MSPLTPPADDERVGNAQRSHVLDLLSRALEGGYLTLDEYEQRMTTVSSAKLASELRTQLRDLPAQFQWDPRQQPPPPPQAQRAPDDSNVRAFAVTALSLGIASIPLSVCLVGWLFGLAAIFFSIPGGRGASGWSKAIIGRILGFIGIILSIGVIVLVVVSPDTSKS
jgi:hypothetical protein